MLDQAGAWAAGAEGERRVASALYALPTGWTVVHDRLLKPGRSEANLDHLVIGPTGVYLVDAKNRAGRVIEYEGGLFQHRQRDGRPESVSLAAELKKVHGMAAYMAAESDEAVTPVLCLAGARADEFGEPAMVRGVWVVPVSALAGWLRGRPVVITPERLPGVTTRVITDFPSTTTDAALLSAIGGAAARKPRGRGGARSRGRAVAPPSRPAAPRTSRRGPRRMGRFLLFGSGVALALALLAQLPAFLTAGVERLAAVGAPTAQPTGAASQTAAAKTPAAKAPAAKAAAKAAAAQPLGPPDCATATAAQITAVIHRAVKPIAVSRGCAWGTRLDDPSTQLVTITMTDDHAAYDLDLTTSVKQKRVVFGGAVDGTYRPATKASVATGQLIVRGSKPVRARADTVVVVATTRLVVNDDRARAMAVAIAAAANAGG